VAGNADLLHTTQLSERMHWVGDRNGIAGDLGDPLTHLQHHEAKWLGQIASHALETGRILPRQQRPGRLLCGRWRAIPGQHFGPYQRRSNGLGQSLDLCHVVLGERT